MRILFWGTPHFAVPSLAALIGEGHEVVGVVTQPDRPQGRSRSTLVPPPVKELALAEGIPVFQPDVPRGAEFIEAIRALKPDLSVVVAYGHILTQEVIDLPTRGTVNIHASLLPRWRGAAPIQADETGGELTERLSELGALTIVECLAAIELSKVDETPQDESQVTYAPKIERASARLDFTKPATLVARAIRGYDPKPGAWGILRDTEIRLFGARVLPDRKGQPGEVLEIDEMGLVIACGEGAVAIEAVHPAGKRRVAALDFAQGRGVARGDYLS